LFKLKTTQNIIKFDSHNVVNFLDQSCNDNVVSGYYCIDEMNYDTADDTDICNLKAPQVKY